MRRAVRSNTVELWLEICYTENDQKTEIKIILRSSEYADRKGRHPMKEKHFVRWYLFPIAAGLFLLLYFGRWESLRPVERSFFFGMACLLLLASAVRNSLRKDWNRWSVVMTVALAAALVVTACLDFRTVKLGDVLEETEGVTIDYVSLYTKETADGLPRDVVWMPEEGTPVTVSEGDPPVLSGGEADLNKWKDISLRKYWRWDNVEEDPYLWDVYLSFSNGQSMLLSWDDGWKIIAGHGRPRGLRGYWYTDRPLSDFMDPQVLDYLASQMK